MRLKIGLIVGRILDEYSYNNLKNLISSLNYMKKAGICDFTIVLCGISPIENDIKKKLGVLKVEQYEFDKFDSGDYSREIISIHSGKVRKLHPGYKNISKKSFNHMCIITHIVRICNLVVAIPNSKGNGRGGYALKAAHYYSTPRINLNSGSAKLKIDKLTAKIKHLQKNSSAAESTSKHTGYKLQDLNHLLTMKVRKNIPMQQIPMPQNIQFEAFNQEIDMGQEELPAAFIPLMVIKKVPFNVSPQGVEFYIFDCPREERYGHVNLEYYNSVSDTCHRTLELIATQHNQADAAELSQYIHRGDFKIVQNT